MAKVKKSIYSLWLIPEKQAYSQFSLLISNLSKKYLTFPFEPHVTLLSMLLKTNKEAIEKTQTFKKQIKSLRITLTKLYYLDEYFKCVFYKTKKTKKLFNYNLLAKKIFKVDESQFFMPHLSVIYANLSEEIKKEIIQQIGNRYNGLNFRVEKIALYKTGNNVQDWQKLGEYNL